MCGTMNESYKYWHQHDKTTESFYQQYKINNDGECVLCKQAHKQIYNFCVEEHDEGMCYECFTHLKSF